MRKINPLYKIVECKNQEKCKFGVYCLFYHNSDPVI